MKITILNGSPRINGNTSTLIKSFMQGAKDAGHDVEVIQVGTMKINGCIACEYCHTNGNGECAIKDDMQKVYKSLADAEMVIFASPVYYWSFTGQMQSTISRIYAIEKPQHAQKYGMILTSSSDEVYNALISQYHDVIDYFGAVDMGIITAYGSQRNSESKLKESYAFGNRL